MTYARVIPRDLFNEADLLRCIGRLAIALGSPETNGHDAGLGDPVDGEAFDIQQDPNDGSISVANVPLIVSGRNVRLYRPLNSRQPLPLWVAAGEIAPALEDFRVFEEDGALTDDFRQFIGLPR